MRERSAPRREVRVAPQPQSAPAFGAETSDAVAAESRTVVVAGVAIGVGHPVRVVAGPCSVEGEEQFHEAAVAVKAAGASLLRGGAFKPRTSPYAFQGLGRRGLEIMRAVGDELGMGVVTEAMAAEDIEIVAELADMVQIGARNMDNRALLESAAASGRPILLKRGITSTVDEVLRAADLIVRGDNEQVVICERGSRTFEPSTRNSLDVAAVPEVKFRAGFPVLFDPSHGTGRRDIIVPVSLAGIAAGADGIIIEVHPNPAEALSDGPQSWEAGRFHEYMDAVRAMASAVDRAIP
jgi:3-deoxy-7-phosphoheptulonate synthase